MLSIGTALVPWGTTAVLTLFPDPLAFFPPLFEFFPMAPRPREARQGHKLEVFYEEATYELLDVLQYKVGTVR